MPGSVDRFDPRRYMLDPAMTGPSTDQHRDRSTGLVVFGVAEILIGIACASLIPLTLVGAALSPTVEPGIVIPSLLLYAAGAAVFVTLGVGSIRARRWAQALSLSLGWIWLITGVATVVVVWIAAPTLWQDLGAGAGLDDGTARIVAVAVNLVLLVVYVLLPGAIVLFYRSPHVIATCRRRDSDPGWAGRCPQQLLSLAVAYALCALSIVAVPSYNFVFPFFGWILSGATGALCWALAMIFCLALAWGTLRGALWAWRTAIGGCVVGVISSVATSARVDPAAIFDAMNLQPDQLILLEQLWPEKTWVHIVLWLLIWGSLGLYLITVRGFFGGSGSGRMPHDRHSEFTPMGEDGVYTHRR